MSRQPDYDHAGLHRSRDLGITGFTGFHNQRMHALREVPRGGELFVDYGPAWFSSRGDALGAVPVPADYARVDRLLSRFRVRPSVSRVWKLVLLLGAYLWALRGTHP